MNRWFALGVLSVVVLCASGTVQQRTWKYDFRGVCQAGVASAAVNFPMANAPLYVACRTDQLTSQWSVPAGTAGTSFWVVLTVPPGASASSEFDTTTVYNTADGSPGDSAQVQIEEACVPVGAYSSNPTFYAVGNQQGFSGTGGPDTAVTGSFTPACNSGSTLYVKYEVMANSLSQPLNFTYVGVSVKGAP